MRKIKLRGLVCICAAVLIAAPAPAQILSTDAQLQRAQNLTRANLFELAAATLEKNTPALLPGEPPDEQWLRWTRQLWSVYRRQGRWRELYISAHLPSYFPANLRGEAALQRVDALLKLQRAGEARALIRRQLLTASAPPRQRQLRQKLIASYLADDLLAESQLAVQKFNQEYREADAAWLLLSAGVLLRAGEHAAAINLLAPLQQAEARLLRLYARLNDASLTPAQVAARARELQPTGDVKKLTRELQAVLVAAQSRAGDWAAVAAELELYLPAPASNFDAQRIYPRFTPQNLFNAYARVAEDSGNAANLLRGDDAKWLQYARELAPGEALPRRALFAYLIVHAAEDRVRRRAADNYVDELITADRGELIKLLFGADKLFGALTLGGATGMRLVRYGLARGDFALAAAANASVSQLPVGVDRAAWLLRAARVDIFAGRSEAGAAKLREWLTAAAAANATAAARSLTSAQTDAVLQPIFDLQTVGKHKLARPLLYEVYARAPTPKLRREIAYWVAESYAGESRHRQAAEWFLHSALMRADGLDQWGEAARLRAAQDLIKAALFADAEQIYQTMLTRADTPEQQRQLRQKLQQIALLRANAKVEK